MFEQIPFGIQGSLEDLVEYGLLRYNRPFPFIWVTVIAKISLGELGDTHISFAQREIDQ
jgi:hypothetical protein